MCISLFLLFKYIKGHDFVFCFIFVTTECLILNHVLSIPNNYQLCYLRDVALQTFIVYALFLLCIISQCNH